MDQSRGQTVKRIKQGPCIHIAHIFKPVNHRITQFWIIGQLQAIWVFLIQNARFLQPTRGGYICKPSCGARAHLCSLGMGFGSGSAAQTIGNNVQTRLFQFGSDII